MSFSAPKILILASNQPHPAAPSLPELSEAELHPSAADLSRKKSAAAFQTSCCIVQPPAVLPSLSERTISPFQNLQSKPFPSEDWEIEVLGTEMRRGQLTQSSSDSSSSQISFSPSIQPSGASVQGLAQPIPQVVGPVQSLLKGNQFFSLYTSEPPLAAFTQRSSNQLSPVDIGLQCAVAAKFIMAKKKAETKEYAFKARIRSPQGGSRTPSPLRISKRVGVEIPSRVVSLPIIRDGAPSAL
jgi:hypothetical protein